LLLLDPGQIKGMQILSNLTHLKQKNPFVLGHTATAYRRITAMATRQPSLCMAAAGGVALHCDAAAAAAPYLSLAPNLMKKAFSELSLSCYTGIAVPPLCFQNSFRKLEAGERLKS